LVGGSGQYDTLIVDWGGVLTTSLNDAVTAWADRRGVRLSDYFTVMRDWLGEAAGLEAVFNPIHSLERGEIEIPHFEEHLAEALTKVSGHPVEPVGLVEEMFEFFDHAPDMNGLVHRARQQGIRTALLSNSWGNSYPRDGWDDMFDAVVISGEVGMRKPEHRIYQHTLALLSAPAETSVFVDDLKPNVMAAEELGMGGVVHSSYEQTAAVLEAQLGVPLR
jgi:epoxide hydrolase-like predicted phosphatase